MIFIVLSTWQVIARVHPIHLMSRAHSFPRQILLNSAALFAKFRGSPRQILGNPRLTAAAHFRVHCADWPSYIYLIILNNKR